MPKTCLRRSPAFFAAAFAILAAACGDSPADPDDDLNPALVEEANGAGIASGSSEGLPQGAAPFTGPGGIAMDATAEEFFQQLTFDDGTVWRTSGISIFAVPTVPTNNSVVGRLGAAAAITGSLESVDPGSYTLGPPPTINFIDEIPYYGAYIRRGSNLRESHYAEEGTFTISSVEYFDDVYTCTLRGNAFIVDRCDYQVGVLTGSVEFRVELDDGTQVVQERTSFSLPIRRRTIIIRRP